MLDRILAVTIIHATHGNGWIKTFRSLHFLFYSLLQFSQFLSGYFLIRGSFVSKGRSFSIFVCESDVYVLQLPVFGQAWIKSLFGEFDPGSERTLAAWIRHASRTELLAFSRV